MFLADYHLHSSCSPDAHNTMSDMALAAHSRGMTCICFTDHSDFDIPETMQFGPDSYKVPDEQARQYREALESAPSGLRICLGLELGEANHAPERALAVYNMPDYDFILGSLHNLRDREDFYEIRYRSEEQCHRLYDLYLDELIELAAIPCFDALAHLGYCRRYMSKQGMNAAVTMERNGDKIDKILRILIENGRGLELNCADIIAGGRPDALLETFPSVPILRRYRELGGEIITVGSDGHRPCASGFGIAEGYALLRENGFRYVAAYHNHKPEFVSI
ncbi:MAG: histidinol-phosphatase HisJ family protein [Oscillospiraceae bacterium]